ncbi:hypothetical protein [Pleomorphovibrio marinus]|uniref:hypothetical protein n=1 Tax=Pleomorphovibrio marinus TaxID=2164132 RepID=UPI000E0AF373|nr:hypothetical protein [Pleomorphovibrio marinus]
MSDKITIHELKNYLGTGLKCKHPWENVFWRLDIGSSNDEVSIKTALWMQAKPLCYRLSDLDRFIPELGFVPIDEISEKMNINRGWWRWKDVISDNSKVSWLDFRIVDQLFRWHFWPFDQSFFTKGLLIDKMTYGKEGGDE